MPVKNGTETVCVPLYWLNARGFKRDGSALHLQRISPLPEKLTSGRTLCRIRAKDIWVQKLVPIWLWRGVRKNKHYANLLYKNYLYVTRVYTRPLTALEY